MPARIKGPTDHVVIVGAGLGGLSVLRSDLQALVEKLLSSNAKVFPVAAMA